jgi:N-methylhydantoinase A/oxoprolinase/acetone carboxylase beta subunit
MLRLGIDVGGTNTDAVVIDGTEMLGERGIVLDGCC